jgi:endonuclease/exonuclease/phosphatase family metal-dependent hydrolase
VSGIRAVALGLVLATAVAAAAIDVPVRGRRLVLRGGRARVAHLLVRDAAVAAPLPDPRPAATLVVSGGAGAGQCFAAVALAAVGWTPLGGDGPARGWRWRPPAGGGDGVREVVVRPGRLAVAARGAAWPCMLRAGAERVPVTATLQLGTTRWCAAFGGKVTRNKRGRFVARDAVPPDACPDGDVTVASLNLLHGLACPPETALCRRAERVQLLFQWIAARGCPDAVAVQEVQGNDLVALVTALAATACPFPYTMSYAPVNMVDDSIVLSRYPVAASDTTRLFGVIRFLHHLRIDHPRGPLDLFNTHLASGGDGAGDPCAADCPASCVAAGATTVRECQGVQVGELVARAHADVGAMPAVVAGDFNEPPTSAVHARLVAAGLVDSYLAAGNPECEPGSGVGCTAGRIDDALTELESPASNETERIDYLLVLPPADARTCGVAYDPPTDADGDGTATRLFADAPNPFSPSCGPAPLPMCWPSDHEGTELDLTCD